MKLTDIYQHVCRLAELLFMHYLSRNVLSKSIFSIAFQAELSLCKGLL
jgi:hypothetical protein